MVDLDFRQVEEDKEVIALFEFIVTSVSIFIIATALIVVLIYLWNLPS